MSNALPLPGPDALAHSDRLVRLIMAEIEAHAGWISFARYMELALYAPALGYYSAGSRKLGRGGDFTTAPEMTPLFGQALATPIALCIDAGLPAILEVGAGSGMLAASILERLESLDALPDSYQILELSGDLRERERDTLAARVPHLLERVVWLNGMPPGFEGVVIGNEVLDAMPVEIIRWELDGSLKHAGVIRGADGGLSIAFRPIEDRALRQAAEAIGVQPPYQSEIGLSAQGFVRTLGEHIARGFSLFIDYGFPEREFYHPDRSTGTLMCHYQHRAHQDPLLWPGLQDITAHVNFSAAAHAALDSGMTVAGYCSQADFLINCAILDRLAAIGPEQTGRYLPAAGAVQRLLSPSEMGELFKVIGFARDAPLTLDAFFSKGDRSGTLDASGGG